MASVAATQKATELGDKYMTRNLVISNHVFRSAALRVFTRTVTWGPWLP